MPCNHARRRFARALLLPLVLPLAGFGSLASLFAPARQPWPRWAANDPASMLRVDHAAWTALLLRYLVPGEVNRFRYRAVTPEHRRALAGYIDGLAAVRIDRYRRDEQLAYWINLYNALTVATVLDHYPVASIRDIAISPGLFATGPWGRKLVAVEGEAISLNDIEHRILRPIWNDPRIHYAVNCAALGCPNLQPVAFTAANADRLLTEAARAFVNGRGAAVIDGRLIVSSLYDWYADDFGGEAGVLDHLRRFAEPALAARLAGIDRIAGDTYDWRLNDADGP